MSENVTATAESVPASSYLLVTPLCTKLTLVAERLLRRPDRLERLYKQYLKSLEGPECLELMAEIYEPTQERGKVAACSAKVLIKIVENWTDKDLEEMGVYRAAEEESVGLRLGLILLAKLDTGISRYKRHYERRITAI